MKAKQQAFVIVSANNIVISQSTVELEAVWRNQSS